MMDKLARINEAMAWLQGELDRMYSAPEDDERTVTPEWAQRIRVFATAVDALAEQQRREGDFQKFMETNMGRIDPPTHFGMR